MVEAMKMEYALTADLSGIVRAIVARPGQILAGGDVVLFVEPAEVVVPGTGTDAAGDPNTIRPDLAEVLERRRAIGDDARAGVLEKRRGQGKLSARERVGGLFDGGDFLEYGEFALAAQRRRREPAELQRMSPADGLIAGVGSVNGDRFDAERARCIAMAYDYTVFAGTQGYANHLKTDRMLHLAQTWRVPLVMFAEGGGGRPGDSDVTWASGLAVPTFASYARLSGLVPIVGVVSGFCFAGNAAFLGCSDVIIATRDANIGMGGPAMIEGGGLGTFAPEEIGPVADQAPSGVIDVIVDDDAEAVDVARRYLSYFQGAVGDWQCADQRELRRVVPDNRVRVYDVRDVISTLADTGSVLELTSSLRARHGDRAHPHRRPAVRSDREQPDSPRRRDRWSGRRQSVAVHAALRCVRCADRLAVRHTRFPRRTGGRTHRPSAARQPHVRHRREHDGSGVLRRPAQGVRPGCASDGGRQPARTVLLGVVADR